MANPAPKSQQFQDLEIHPLTKITEVYLDTFYDFFKDTFKLKTDVPFVEKKIKHATLLRPQFALAGYTTYFLEDAITLFGNTEINFLNELPKDKRIEVINQIAKFRIPCVILSGKATLDDDLILIFAERGIPVFSTKIPTPILMYQILDWLDDYFSPRATTHGNLVSVHDVGVLLIGKSGIGKSELTLDLLRLGHKLVADDLVILSRKWANKIVGYPKSSAEHYLEIRGSGIIDIDRIYGVKALIPEKEVSLIINLKEYNPEDNDDPRADYKGYEINEKGIEILGVTISLVDLYVKVGRYLPPLIEDIVLYHHSKRFAYNPKSKLSTKSPVEVFQIKPFT